jgi:hypothetical protein
MKGNLLMLGCLLLMATPTLVADTWWKCSDKANADEQQCWGVADKAYNDAIARYKQRYDDCMSPWSKLGPPTVKSCVDSEASEAGCTRDDTDCWVKFIDPCKAEMEPVCKSSLDFFSGFAATEKQTARDSCVTQFNTDILHCPLHGLCDSDTDCMPDKGDAGPICSNHQCVPKCTDDFQCPGAQRCDRSTGKCYTIGDDECSNTTQFRTRSPAESCDCGWTCSNGTWVCPTDCSSGCDPSNEPSCQCGDHCENGGWVCNDCGGTWCDPNNQPSCQCSDPSCAPGGWECPNCDTGGSGCTYPTPTCQCGQPTCDDGQNWSCDDTSCISDGGGCDPNDCSCNGDPCCGYYGSDYSCCEYGESCPEGDGSSNGVGTNSPSNGLQQLSGLLHGRLNSLTPIAKPWTTRSQSIGTPALSSLLSR